MAYKGKAIYNPSGKAGEYSYWACNFYVGCSNECTYCYLKKGRGANILGGNTPTLKKCFKNEEHALDVFMSEVANNDDDLRKHGLFFSFTTDPMLNETKILTLDAVEACNGIDIPVKILTKRADIKEIVDIYEKAANWKKELIAIGYTLTGHDELEIKASSDFKRIESLIYFNKLGYKTFVSLEPLIDFGTARWVIKNTINYCDLFKIGLESGKKYSKDKAQKFISDVILVMEAQEKKVYFKDSLLKCAEYKRDSLNYNCCVERDYNLFNK